MDKKDLRKIILSKRAEIQGEMRSQYEEKILSTLVQNSYFQQARRVASFVSFRDELSTYHINQTILDLGKELLLPYISMASKQMTFHRVHSLDELVLSTYGIYEPDPSKHELVSFDEIDLVLTPGLAFDAQGFRLGYGGGFYDRLFQTIKKTIPKIGLAFDVQCIESLPVDTFDRPITHLITEKGITDYHHLV